MQPVVSRDRVAQGRKDSAPRAGEKQREAAKMQQAKQAKSRQRHSGAVRLGPSVREVRCSGRGVRPRVGRCSAVAEWNSRRGAVMPSGRVRGGCCSLVGYDALVYLNFYF